MKTKDFLAVFTIGCIVLHLLPNLGEAFQGSYVWTKRMGGSSIDEGNGITTDLWGNVYIIGNFAGTVDFGSDFGSSDIKTSAGASDAFITKISADGTYGWTRRIGGTSGDDGFGITTDQAGNVYLTGVFRDIVDFGADFGQADNRTSAGASDIFITRINADGTYGWTRRVGGINFDYGLSITSDQTGNIYVTGYFMEAVNFGADFGNTDTKSTAGLFDIFITKISSNGTYGWTRRMGGASNDIGYGITTDQAGNIYITGSFYDIVDFGADFGPIDIKASSGACDIFITKIKADGGYGWTRRMGGTSLDEGNGIATDLFGNIYVMGCFEGIVDFGADFWAHDTKTSSGSIDIFVTKIKANGSYGWTRRIGGTSTEEGSGIAADSSGNIHVTGCFEDVVDFGADFGSSDIKTASGSDDIFITRINTDGTYGWTRRMGGAYQDRGLSTTTDYAGNIYIAGHFFGLVNFGADFGTTDISIAGNRDIFITKLIMLPSIFDGHDFNGNGSSDVSVFRPSNGRWYIKDVGNYAWGAVGDIPVNGDYNGDGSTDIAVWRPMNGRWYLKGMRGESWGTAGDIPVPGNYDGDVNGTTDIAVWRPSNGRWYIKDVGGYVWGQAGDIPVPGDYNGDGTTEIAVWRPSNGRWYIKGITGYVWGMVGDIPVPADYNGDGRTEIAVWRPSNGRWYIKGVAGSVWGTIGDVPAPGDYNGDGITDIAVWRPSNGQWYIKGIGGYIWGMLGDIPLVR